MTATVCHESYGGVAPELATSVIGQALRGGGDAAELFVEERHSLSLRLEDGKIENAISGSDLGGSIRVMRGLSTVFGYVDSVEEKALLRLAGELSRSRARRNEVVATMTAQHAGEKQRSRVDPAGVPVSVKAGLLHLADESARGVSGEIRQVVAAYSESRQRIWVAGSHGRLAADDRTRVMLSVTVMAERDGLIQIGRDTLAHHGGFELLSEKAVAELAGGAARTAVTMLDSKPAPAGRMPVVLANGFGGVLFHEACGHGLEADFILKKSSVWEGRIGQKVAGEHVFAYDDGIGGGLWGSCGCDDEGTPCQRTTLIDAGVLTSFLSDRLRAAYLGLPLTGNGRRQDYRYVPYPRMTNTYFGPGPHTSAELIVDTPRGLYAKSLAGGEVNPATGDFVFAVSEGYLIENGKVTTPVRGATLIGNGPEVLKGIDAIADDLEVEAGTCGKEGQGVPVGTGQPTLRIRELTVGGTNLS
ncbi:MAG: TldD/PmbA family protein [Thermoleophilia bacterium]|nr:TldD/PmbA family protein [Thermoleophilia bacterium]